MSDEELASQFAKHGAPQVRAMLGEWTGPVKMAALAWLASQDEDERLRNEACQASQMFIALSAKRAAWIAAIAAIIAAIAAILTIVVELVKK